MATLKDTIVLGNLSTTGTLNATTIYEGGTSLVDKYAAKSHTHSYLPLSGGTIDAGGSKAPLILKGGVGSFREGLRIIPPNNKWATILLGGSDVTESEGTSPNSWAILNNDGKLYISKNGDASASTKLSNTDGTWRVNDNDIIHAGNIGSQSVNKTNLLNPHQNVSSTNKSTWDPMNSGKVIWGQGFINNSISTDSGDLTLFLRGSQYSANGTELCMNIDGDYYSFGKKVIHSGGGTLTGNLCFKEISNGTFPVTSSGIVWNGSTDNAAIFYRLDASDAGRLVFKTGDDTNCNFVWNNTSSGDIMQLTGAGELTVKGTSNLSNVNCNGNIRLSHITGADPDGTIKTRYIKNIDFKVNEGSSTAEFPLSISSNTNIDLNASNSLDISSGSYMWLSAGGGGNNNSIDMDDEGIRLSTKGALSLECGNFKTIANNSYLGGIKPWYSTTGSSKYNNGTTAPSAGSDSPNINERSTTTGRYYAVEMDADGRAYVNVPWPSTTAICEPYYYTFGANGSWRIYQYPTVNSLDIKYGVIDITSQSGTYNVSFNRKNDHERDFMNSDYTVVFGLYRSDTESWFWSPIVRSKTDSGFTVFLRGNASRDNGGKIMYIAIRSN